MTSDGWPAFDAVNAGTSTAAIMPGMTMTSGMSALGYAPMIGVRRAADMSLAESARWTSAKFVVQYPNDSTKPSPNTMPTTDQNGFSIPVSGVPGQASSSAPSPAAMIFS